MTAQRAEATHVVRLRRSDRPGWWARGYFEALIGCGVRVPAGFDASGRVLSGLLLAADEDDEDEIVLTFGELGPEE